MKPFRLLAAALCSFVAGLILGGLDRHLHNRRWEICAFVFFPVVLGGVFARYFYLLPFALTLGFMVFYWPGAPGMSAVGSSVSLAFSPVLLLIFFVEVLLGSGLSWLLRRLRSKPGI